MSLRYPFTACCRAYPVLTVLLRYLLVLLLLCVIRAGAAQAQTTQMPPAFVPSAYQSGSDGSALSSLDNINFYNGSLNANLPLVTLGGRGEASFSMILSVGRGDWRVEVQREIIHQQPLALTFSHYVATPTRAADPSALHAGLGPGLLRADQNVTLYDTLTDGKPLPASNCDILNGPSRGTTFVARDGSNITFVADAAIHDYGAPNITNPTTGTVYFPNGVQYRIDATGRVDRITDRNGNWVNFTYSEQYNLNSDFIAEDTLGRRVEVATLPNSITAVTTKGFGGASRTIRLYAGGALRSDYTNYLTYAQAFPTIAGNGNMVPTGLVPAGGGLSAVELPDGRQYKFFYNQYSDLARIELPTGGAIEYDWGGTDFGPRGDTYQSPDTNWGTQDIYGQIFRWVTERRVYANGGSGNDYTSKMVGGLHNETVYGKDAQGNLTPISSTRHYFYGNPFQHYLNPYYNESWRDGREFQTEVYSGDGGSGSQLLRRVENNWHGLFFAPAGAIRINARAKTRVSSKRLPL
jgi:hypothetical protein